MRVDESKFRPVKFKELCRGAILVTADDASDSTEKVARIIGVVEKIPGVTTVQRLTAKLRSQASPASYSGIYGLGRFPLHTDMAHWTRPPRYLMLRCIVPDPSVKTTILLSQFALQGEDEIELKRSLFRPRRRIDGRLTVTRLYQEGMFRWDPLFIEPLNARGMALSDRVKSRFGEARPMEISLENPGESLIIDNWLVLHGRTEIEGCNSPRIVDRVYLSEINL